MYILIKRNGDCHGHTENVNTARAWYRGDGTADNDVVESSGKMSPHQGPVGNSSPIEIVSETAFSTWREIEKENNKKASAIPKPSYKDANKD